MALKLLPPKEPATTSPPRVQRGLRLLPPEPTALPEYTSDIASDRTQKQAAVRDALRQLPFFGPLSAALDGKNELLDYGILTADEVEPLRAMIAARDPGAKLLIENGRQIVQRADGKRYVLNAEGLSMNDLRQFGAEALPYALPGPGGKIAGGVLGAAARGAGQALPGAVVNAMGQGAARSAAGLDVDPRARATGALADVTVGAVATPLIEPLLRGAARFGKGAGNTILDMLSPRKPDPLAAERAARAAEFNIPLSGPQLQGDEIGLGRLAQIGRGSPDTPGRKAVVDFNELQAAGRAEASDKLRQRFVPSGVAGEDLGNALQAPLVKRANELYSRYNSLYESIPTNATVNPAFFGGQEWRGFLKGASEDLKSFAPELIGDVTAILGDAAKYGAKGKGVEFRAGWNGLRQRLNQVVRADPGSAQAVAARKVLDRFSAAEDALASQPGNIMVNASASGNSPTSEGLVNTLREANALRKDYAKTFEGDDVISQIVESRRPGAQGGTLIDATSLSEKLFGKTRTNINFTNFDQKIARLKEVAPEQIGAVRADVMDRLLTKIDDAPSFGKMADALDFVAKNEKRLGSLFSPDELALVRRYAQARADSMRTSGAVSPSGGSVSDLRRAILGGMYSGGAAIMGTTLGGPALGAAFAAAGPIATQIGRASEARTARKLIEAGQRPLVNPRVVPVGYGDRTTRQASRAFPSLFDYLTPPDR